MISGSRAIIDMTLWRLEIHHCNCLIRTFAYFARLQYTLNWLAKSNVNSNALNVLFSIQTEFFWYLEAESKRLVIHWLKIVRYLYVLVVKAVEMWPHSLKFCFMFINQGVEFGSIITIEPKFYVRARVMLYFNFLIRNLISWAGVIRSQNWNFKVFV